ncbi:MAG: D-2-hydroxyacid dehydrogenase [Clostridia bacterium]|nr:D-2-hydroxyacid dehydrogenase [Clostridia bacterium]
MKILLSDCLTLTKDGDIDLNVFEKYGSVTCKDNIKEDELLSVIGEYDAVLCNKTNINKAVIDAAQKLSYIGVFATGYNNIDIKEATKKGITVCNAGTYSTNSVAQQTFAYILYHTNKIAEYDKRVKSGEWKTSKTFTILGEKTEELAGKTIGIIGYGNIGKKVADIALAFDMNVLVYSRSKKEDNRVTFTDFKILLQESDIVTVHCPLNEQSKGMFDKKAFSLMKKDALFINTARGPIVNESDLLDVLSSKKIYAAIDVLDKEPMEKDNLLFGAPNIIITPHVAWAPLQTRKRLIDITVKNLENFINGTPTNKVN